MCGISGFLHFDNKRIASKKIIRKMTDTLSHRGPDGEGFYLKKNIALGHRRLSIIDLNTGDQPMVSESGNVVLIFNGEIYNYIEIREDLIKIGYSFHTSSDTEVIIKAYEEWGTNCVLRFNGMWAFAIWDCRNKELFLSRDRIGEKPLYYSLFEDTFIFGSELKALFAYGVPKEPSLELLEIYTTFKNIPAPFTFFKNIKKLMPGHSMIVNSKGFRESKYWDLPFIDEKNLVKDKKYVYKEFESLFHQAVKLRMRSDVPFGAFLSGGLDSASIVALMSGMTSIPIKTFTIGYDEKDFDETILANMVAEKYRTEHATEIVRPDSFEEIVSNIVFHYDEPFGDSSAIPTGYVSKFASQHVKMVLTGDGGDEALSGYPSYQGVKFSDEYSQLPLFIQDSIKLISTILQSVVPRPMRYKMNRYHHLINTALDDFNSRLLNKRAKPDIDFIVGMINPDIKTISVKEYMDDFMNSCPYKGDFYRQMYFNYKFDLPNDYLVKVDRMSMAFSLETRLPFLDHHLVEFLVGVDKSIKMEGWERKSILRHTIAQRLPKQLLKASKKGFRVPLREWFKDELLKNHLKEIVSKSNVINDFKLKQIIFENEQSIADHGNLLWSLMILGKVIN